MEADAAAERAEEAAEAREEEIEEQGELAEESAEGEGEQAEESAEAAAEEADEAAEAESDRAADTEYLVDFADGIDLLDLHVLLGVSILALGVTRVVWRRVGGLPPWAAALSDRARRFLGWTEKALLFSMFAMPLSGVALVLTQENSLVLLHVATHVVLGVALLGHVGLVLRHTLVRRDHLLSRMLPGRDRTRSTV